MNKNEKIIAGIAIFYCLHNIVFLLVFLISPMLGCLYYNISIAGLIPENQLDKETRQLQRFLKNKYEFWSIIPITHFSSIALLALWIHKVNKSSDDYE